jgi:signal transduction histidine kinase
LFRIAQEAVSNAVRHSAATNMEIEWKREKQLACLVVRDNGKGMKEKNKVAGGIGLFIMESRAHAIQASFEIKNRSEGGTEVRCCCLEAGGKCGAY